MTKQRITERTVSAINRLPPDKAEETLTYADFLIKRFEEKQPAQGIQKLAAESQVFDFLNEEEDLYSEADLIEVYNG